MGLASRWPRSERCSQCQTLPAIVGLIFVSLGTESRSTAKSIVGSGQDRVRGNFYCGQPLLTINLV